jgi:hypothetical protein
MCDLTLTRQKQKGRADVAQTLLSVPRAPSARYATTYHSLMPNIAGVDGCPSGWIAVVEQAESHNITGRVFLTFSDLTDALDAAVIAIDIPIGLTDHGPRQCDLDARSHLASKRGASVFPAPIRSALPRRRTPRRTQRSRRASRNRRMRSTRRFAKSTKRCRPTPLSAAEWSRSIPS